MMARLAWTEVVAGGLSEGAESWAIKGEVDEAFLERLLCSGHFLDNRDTW